MNVDYLSRTFWDKVETSNWWACWTWQQSTGGHHYGQTWDAENAADNGNARKTHCPAGHPYAGDNVKVHKQGYRLCKACDHARRKAS